MGLLDLPSSPRKLVFRRIIKQLRNDPIVRRTFRTILAYEGGPNETRELTQANAPGLRIVPTCGPDIWAFPDAQRGWLYMDVDIMVPGYDVGDMLDAWWALARALYPPNPLGLEPSPAQVFQKELREVGIESGVAGAYTGLIEFSQPAADDSPSDQVQQSRAQMKVEILLNLYT